MGKFTTPKLEISSDPVGNFSVIGTGNIEVKVNANGKWRTKPAGGRLFTDEEIRDIRYQKMAHPRLYTYKELGELYDCSAVMIRQIVLRAAYADVP